jgi:hypothetical protein
MDGTRDDECKKQAWTGDPHLPGFDILSLAPSAFHLARTFLLEK